MITLTNGKIVANFSSPHDFTFEDGSILPAVSNSEAERLKVTFHEEIDSSTGDVILDFSLSHEVWEEMNKYYKLWWDDEVNVVFCPLPMITALHKTGYNVKVSPFRAVRITDRIKKLVSINYQCI